ncbi:MAG: DNA polymerase III subunit gamma/tau [Treponema sp.]|jgi:DNA polymerase-3 subunit gamma/tau|nr:DNA polymerase III subunit gamma/tau [Treponema sp.]
MAKTYEVTASKYRPKTFDELAGQEFVVSTIKNSLKSGKIANAYLFSGPRGCGKTSAARILARSLNCEKGLEQGPCGICDNCVSISKGASMDVLEIDGATNKSIDDIKQIKDEVLFPPQTGRFKVYIIDEVHMLTIQAFNALLKTIEEPPPYIVFIFATTESHKVPATIKSRCQQFNFRLIPVETIQEILKKICAESNINAEDEALFWIAKESTGSMRDAFTLFDQVVSFSDGNIQSDVIREKLGITGLEKLNAFAEACAENNSAGVFALTDEVLSSGVAIEQFIIDLAGYYRSLLLFKNNVTKESLLGFRPSLFSVKVLDTYDTIRLEQALDILLDCYRNIRYSVSPRFDLETAVSKLAWLSRWISPVELKEAVESAQGALVSGQGARLAASSGQPVTRQAQASAPSSTFAPSSPQASAQAAAQKTASVSPAGGNAPRSPYQERSLSDEFNRMVAAKAASSSSDISNATLYDATSDGGSLDASSRDDVSFSGEVSSSDDESSSDDDVPLWDSAIGSKTEGSRNDEKIPHQVETVQSLIPGTIVN